MKLRKRILALCLSVCMCLCLFACGRQEGTQTEGPTEAANTAPQTAAHSIRLVSESGKAFEKVGVYIYEDEALSELVWFARTDDAGALTFQAPLCESYVAVLDGVPDGYAVAEHYALTGTATEIVLSVDMVAGDDLSGKRFALGDVMADISVTDVSGKTCKISELLQEKKAVVLNFWFLSCTPCKMEFPHLQEAYEAYSDQVAVLALNPIDANEADIAAYAQEMGLSFPVAACDARLQQAMQLVSYPTTVVIDRYGIISLVHEGSITSTRSFEDIFSYFAAEDYTQSIVEDVNDILSDEEEEEQINNPTEVGGVTSFQLTVRPGEVVYCDVYRVSDMYMQIKSPNAYLIYKNKTYNPSNGAIGLTVYTPDVRTPATIGLGNNGSETETFTITFSPLRGSLNNPYKMTLGEFDVSVSAGKEEGIYYRYVAEADGYLVLRCLSSTAGIPYNYTLYNLNTYANRNLEADADWDDDGNVVVRIQVKKGQVVQFSAGALPDNNGTYPAIKFRFLASLTEGLDEDDEDDANKLVYAVTVTDENRQPISGIQVYIQTEDGTKTLTTGENGAASVKLAAATYKATIKVPVGYTARTTELTLTEAAPTQAVKFDTVAVVSRTYTVTVTDADGIALANVLVSVGENFAYTDENGKVSFELTEGSYTAVIGVPDGYTADTLTHAFPEGSTELTVVLNKGDDVTDPEGETIPYTVSVVDYYGKPISGVTVTFSRDGAAVGLQTVDESGSAVMQLPKGQYRVSLAFDTGACYYDESAAVLTEDVTSVTVTAVAKRGSDYTQLYVGDAYHVPLGATYVEGMQSNVTNYFIYKPTQSGVYRFTTNDPSALISYWGATEAFIMDQTGTTDYADNAFTRDVRDDQTENTILIVGVTGAQSCIIDITRVGDIYISDEEKAEWIIFEGTQTPAEGTTYKPTERGNLTYVDLTKDASEYTLVMGTDGFYHLGAENGPLVYVNLGPNGRFISFYQMMGFELAGGTNMRQYFYDAEGNFLRKEEYTECLHDYAGAVDAQGYGIYPLTDDLIYILKNGGENKGWWDSNEGNYLFADIEGLNPELGWMFNCCYFE